MINNVAFSSEAGNGLAFFQKFLPALVIIALIAGVVIFFFMLVTGATAWIGSSGDKGLIETARGKVSNALIGIFILLCLFAIVGLVGDFFKINLTTINIHSLFDTATGGTGGTGGGGNGGGGGTGNAACSGCITGGCGITGQVYLGAGTTHYTCTATGWQSTTNPITSQTCGTCN